VTERVGTQGGGVVQRRGVAKIMEVSMCNRIIHF
jgi:hypothetical protein